jgi:TolB-like protein
MKRRNASDAGPAAARGFVRADAGEPGADAELAKWLAERAENERALERVELAAALGKRLAAEPSSALNAEAANAAHGVARTRALARSLAWGGGGALAAAVLLAVLVVPEAVTPVEAPEPVTLRAAEALTRDAPNTAVVVLPSGAVLDASTVAVLPFAAAGDATLAKGLERDVVAALRRVPGLYVIADAAVQPYAATDLGPAELGAQLGARGIVDAAVELADGRVRVSARLRDAVTDATLWRAEVDRPIDELRAIRREIAENVAATMFDARLRERAARADRPPTPVSVSKPIQR